MNFDNAFDFLSIIWLDIVLSGDNALIIGLAASNLSPVLRRRAIIFGLVMATVIRIVFAVMTTHMMAIPGILFVGGLLLIWVAWRLWKEIKNHVTEEASEVAEDVGHVREDEGYTGSERRTFFSALVSITIADFSMSLDNVLAVAAIARGNVPLLVFGLALSIALMGLAATVIMRLLVRFPWISYVGLAFLIYVAAEMLFHGWPDVAHLIGISAAQTTHG